MITLGPDGYLVLLFRTYYVRYNILNNLIVNIIQLKILIQFRFMGCVKFLIDQFFFFLLIEIVFLKLWNGYKTYQENNFFRNLYFNLRHWVVFIRIVHLGRSECSYLNYIVMAVVRAWTSAWRAGSWPSKDPEELWPRPSGIWLSTFTCRTRKPSR